jgi:hypothetical protein
VRSPSTLFWAICDFLFAAAIFHSRYT